MLNIIKDEITLSMGEIIDYYQKSCKQTDDFKVGLEYERLSLNTTTRRNAPYESLKKIIEHFASIQGWGILRDSAGTVIGAIDGATSISLEPGGQFEISLEKKESIRDIEEATVKIITILDKIATAYDVVFIPIGNTPYSTYQNIKIVPKDRYLIMADYLPKKGTFSPVMMRETAGVQVNLDYGSEEDALKKLQLCTKISPFLTGFFANSPMRNGKKIPYKSFRALAWKYTDSERCGIFYKNILKNRPYFGFEDYINEILNVPMLFFERGLEKINVGGKINFKEFIKNGFEGHSATLQDYILHSSLTFPDIRLKNCIEIRNHDSQKLPMALAICAFYKGILHSDSAICEVDELLTNINSENLEKLGFLVAKHGLDFVPFYGKLTPREITKKLFEIANKNLNKQEQKYLEKPLEMLSSGKSLIDEFDLEQFFKN